MSRENVELVRHCLDVANQGDLDEIRALLDETVDAEAELRAVGRLPDKPTVLYGRESIKDFFAQLLDAFDWQVEAEEFIDAGDAVVVVAQQIARGRASGAEVVNHLVYVWGIRDGKVAYLEAYRTRAEALEAAGLSE